MGQISSLVAANALPKSALPLIEAAAIQQPQPLAKNPQPTPSGNTQDTVTISSEAAALQEKSE